MYGGLVFSHPWRILACHLADAVHVPRRVADEEVFRRPTRAPCTPSAIRACGRRFHERHAWRQRHVLLVVHDDVALGLFRRSWISGICGLVMRFCTCVLSALSSARVCPIWAP